MTMRSTCSILLTIHVIAFLFGRADSNGDVEKKISLEIVLPKEVEKTSGCLNIKVLIINNTDTVASFFEDWNSWGYYNIRFELKAEDRTFLLSKYNRDWPKNYPSFKTLFPGDTMALSFSIDYDGCADSQFSGPILKQIDHLSSIKAIYQQSKGALEDANLEGEIKYKQFYRRADKSNRKIQEGWVIVDSLKVPAEVKRTFPLAKLESIEYRLKK